MLVLTRKPGQSIMIGDGIEVQVLSVAGEKVRLGITAPREVAIFRNEVYERINEGEDPESAEESIERRAPVAENGAVADRAAPSTDEELERLSQRS